MGEETIMTSNFEVVIDGAAAQDLFFIEREVSDTKVIEQRTQESTTAFGMPGVVEAVILIAASGAVPAAIAWVLQHRKKGRIKIRCRSEPQGVVSEEIDVEWAESESSAKTIEKVEKWLAGASSIPGTH
jgi:hypothetical protein